jgi:hypothetical protein
MSNFSEELTISFRGKILSGVNAPLFGEAEGDSISDSVRLDDTVAAICNLLGDRQVTKERTSYLLIDAAFSLRHSLSERQKDRIVASIVGNYEIYRVVDLCIKAADYCLRSQPIDASLQSLKSLAAKPLNDVQVYGVLEALEGLYKLRSAYPEIQSQCLQVIQSLRPVRIVDDGG